MGARSRNKGNHYENAVARVLSGWVSAHLPPAYFEDCSLTDLLFRRKPADNDNVVTDWVGGWDLIHRPDFYFPFSVECKKAEGWTMDHLVDGARMGPWSWWEQAVKQAGRIGLEPMLVFSRNLRPDYVMLTNRSATCLNPSPHAGPLLRVHSSSGLHATLLRLADLVVVPSSRLATITVPGRTGGVRSPSRETRTVCRPGKLKRSCPRS